MARTISQIQNQILAQITADPVLGTKLTSPSQVAIYNVFSFIVATALSVEENLRDIFQTEIEATVASAPPGTPQWLVKQVLAFQYNVSNPQVIQLIDFAPQYPVVIPADQVIAQCAVITGPFKNVLIKVAPAVATNTFDQATMDALTTYLDLINFAGVQFSIINQPPDFFMCGANIYYDGQYAGVISNTVGTAITNYITTLPFNGLITLYGGSTDPGLVSAIMNVPGVQDVVFTDVELRSYDTAVDNATVMVTGQQILLRNQGSFSGRAVIDTADGRGLINTLNFIVND